jgi:hypothetical protein
VVAKRINFGVMPIWKQLVFILVVSFLGALAGLALRRNWAALAGLVVVTCGIAVWGVSTRVSDDLYETWQGTARHVLQAAADVPDGDEGFLRLPEIAFAYAEDNSHGTDAVLPNRAAILALGKILGDDSVARVGGRDLDLGPGDERTRLRQRIQLLTHFGEPLEPPVSLARPWPADRLGRARAGHLQKHREAEGFATSCRMVPL